MDQIRCFSKLSPSHFTGSRSPWRIYKIFSQSIVEKANSVTRRGLNSIPEFSVRPLVQLTCSPQIDGSFLLTEHHLSLYTNHLFQGVHHLHQPRLRGHHGIDVLVRHRYLVDHVRILATFYPLGRAHLIFD